MSRTFASIGSFVTYLRERQPLVHAAQLEGLRDAAEMLRDAAQAMIGTEDPEWKPLAEITIAEKEKLGFTGQVSYTDPLLRTGAMRGSIDFAADAHQAVIGSDDPVAVEQELGTSHIPARPFLATTVFRLTKPATELISRHIMAAVTGGPKPRHPPA